MGKYSLNILTVVVFLLLATLYIYCSPFTVQSGDTGELVTNSYFLRVSHPPGYPLWTLLYHLPIKYLNFGNPFATASIFTSLIGLISLLVLYFSLPSVASVLVISVVGTATLIWRYFLFPDVFALHVLFLSIIFFVFMKPHLLNKWWVLFIISLSISHHHTIIFSFPVFVHAFIKSHFTNKKLLLSILFGALSFSVYLVLLTFHPHDYGSWGNLDSIPSVVKHFLRREYGTFALAEESLHSQSWFLFFLKNTVREIWAILLIFGYFLIRYFKDFIKSIKSVSVIVFCLLSYLAVFEKFAKVSLDLTGESTFERFLIMPLFLFLFIFLYFIKDNLHRFKLWMSILLVINLSVNLWKNLDQVNYKNKTGIHDLVVNSFKDLPPKSVFFADGDTFGFAAYYLHEVLGFRKDIYLLHTGWEFPWSSDKAKKKFREIFVNNKNTEFILSAIDLKKFHLYSNTPPAIMPENIRVSMEGIVFHYFLQGNVPLERHKCKEKFLWLKRPEISHFDRFEENTYFDQAYGGCHFDLGLNYLKLGRLELAKLALETSVKLSPFSAKYQERLCFVLSKLKSSKLGECDDRLNLLLRETSPQYYLNKYDF
jgi:hypothetical protein